MAIHPSWTSEDGECASRRAAKAASSTTSVPFSSRSAETRRTSRGAVDAATGTAPSLRVLTRTSCRRGHRVAASPRAASVRPHPELLRPQRRPGAALEGLAGEVADAEVAERGVEDVRPVVGRVQPGDHRLARRPSSGGPEDVLADVVRAGVGEVRRERLGERDVARRVTELVAGDVGGELRLRDALEPTTESEGPQAGPTTGVVGEAEHRRLRVGEVDALTVGSRPTGAARCEQTRSAGCCLRRAGERREGARENDGEASERAGHGGEIGRTHEFLYRFLSNLPP